MCLKDIKLCIVLINMIMILNCLLRINTVHNQSRSLFIIECIQCSTNRVSLRWNFLFAWPMEDRFFVIFTFLFGNTEEMHCTFKTQLYDLRCQGDLRGGRASFDLFVYIFIYFCVVSCRDIWLQTFGHHLRGLFPFVLVYPMCVTWHDSVSSHISHYP